MTISNAHLIVFLFRTSAILASLWWLKKKSIIQREMMLFFPLFTFEKGRFGMFFLDVSQ